jgi:hypothetical protein
LKLYIFIAKIKIDIKVYLLIGVLIANDIIGDNK